VDEVQRMQENLLRPAVDETTGGLSRPDTPEYFMGIAIAVRERANCLGSRVGAVLAIQDRVVATGYNGTPEGMTNCDEGGCQRCANRGKVYPSGTGYDICICVHAEQNALLSAARFGNAVQGAVLYSTMRPCFGCTKELLQAKVDSVYYLHDWAPPEGRLQEEYKRLQDEFSAMRQIEMNDRRADWAHGRDPAVLGQTGHSTEG
jgi:dCMP deaminase